MLPGISRICLLMAILCSVCPDGVAEPTVHLRVLLPDGAVAVVDGAETPDLQRTGVHLKPGRHSLLLRQESRIFSAWLEVSDSAVCSWSPQAERPWSCERP